MPERLEGGRRVRGEIRSVPPLVSIVTVVFRAKDELERILKNVFSLDHEAFELIVIDGGSRDGTVELLQQWNEKVDYWINEPDSGLYYAMNKGRAVARGKFVYHLNAGDHLVYFPEYELERAYIDGVDIATFRVSIDGKYDFVPSDGWLLKVENTFHHQGTFYRRDKFPAYDTAYRVYADFNMNQQLVRRGATVKTYDKVVAFHSTEGISNTSPIAESEHYRIIRCNYGLAYVFLSWLRRKWDGLMVRLGRPVRKV
jgi:glycosyltransferase involved in cell wall biosynthesis